jgi:endonuclease/exonuclease/phosphatase family metal-dependent hydrolase
MTSRHKFRSPAEHGMKRKLEIVFGILSIFLLFFLYRFFTVYTVRSGECKPKPVDPELRLLTRDERGVVVSYPERIGFPAQTKPLVVLTYNIAGHDELFSSKHIAGIADVINAVKPDIVGLQEVHRNTWQSRFHDQLAELEQRTGMHGFFGKSYVQGKGQFGNALLTRGEIVSADVHELPSVGEPRTAIEAVVKIDGATLNVYVAHLTTWGQLNRSNRREQLKCLARHVRTSRYPYLLLGDFNAGPATPEMQEFRKENAAQICGEALPNTNPMMRERIDYIWADYGWRVGDVRVVEQGPSDHWPIVASLAWSRGNQ